MPWSRHGSAHDLGVQLCLGTRPPSPVDPTTRHARPTPTKPPRLSSLLPPPKNPPPNSTLTTSRYLRMRFTFSSFPLDSSFCSMLEMIRHDARRAPITFLYATDKRLRSSTDNSWSCTICATFFISETCPERGRIRGTLAHRDHTSTHRQICTQARAQRNCTSHQHNILCCSHASRRPSSTHPPPHSVPSLHPPPPNPRRQQRSQTQTPHDLCHRRHH